MIMKVPNNLPQIKQEEHLRIPVTDDLHLSARVLRPEGSEHSPVPAILEYIPYRKRFGTRKRDDVTHKYLAASGYACVRLDIRGSGESEGVLEDEYLQSELNDGIRAINWIAEQDWCDGNIGMMGISWGGFNALQIAALQPDPLKAIVTVCSSDDRYADDIHHMGGTLLGDNLSWSSVMFSYNTLPPDPELVGDKWRDMWMQRLEGSGLWLKKWLEHQRRDAYWRHGSVCENYDDIQIPVLAVSGWTDGYTNSVFRLMEHLSVPRKGLIGPWGHTYPHIGRPGPAIDFLGELVDWWDKWLKGKDNGVEKQPIIQAWMQDSVAPYPEYDYRPGRWVIEDTWPSSNIKEKSLTLDTGRHLVEDATNAQTHDIHVQSPVSLGLYSGKWCSYANGPDLAGDQRFDDGGSLVFQTQPLDEDFEILGKPVVEMQIASDKPVAMVAVRLSDMLPDHQVTRVSYGLLNLTHRNGSEHPEKLKPGEKYNINVPLNYIAHKFPKGHRIRLSISTVYWPLAWTAPESAKLTITTGKSRLILPTRPKQKKDDTFKGFGPPVGGPAPDMEQIRPGDHSWTIHNHLADSLTELFVVHDRGKTKFNDLNLTVSAKSTEKYTARSGDFSSTKGITEWHRSMERGNWKVKTRTKTVLSCDTEHFYIQADLDAYEGETRVFNKSWNEKIKRDYI